VQSSKSSRVRGVGVTLVATIVAAFGMTVMASPALAVEHHPKGEFAVFADCPLSNGKIGLCIVAKSESGKFIIGKEEVPLVKTITLQGGIINPFGSPEEFVGAEDGNTLTKVPQKVPGGLAGLVKCNEISNIIERIACEITFENGLTGVNATTELAAPASSIKISNINLLTGTGIALSLPLKVHLENPFLGSSCYVGSNSHPIVVELTTGTTSPPLPNKPITGNPGELSENPTNTILRIKNNELVNNTFSAPEAEGCGGIFSFLINPIIDSRLGLPSSSGHNTAILKGTLEASTPEAVKASE
jgi:hypothetical protein